MLTTALFLHPGRIISEEPNLQCMPRPHALGEAGSINVRSCLVARPCCLFIAADYKQLEYRLMAHLRCVY